MSATDTGGDTVTWETPRATLRARWESLPSRDDAGATAQEGILKCLGIPFADVPYRWAAPRPTPFSWSGTRDCTAFGPGCPQTSQPLFDVEDIPLFGHVGKKSLPVRADVEDEFSCLNLNVFAPALRDSSDRLATSPKPLPVLVWVHGGGYTVGAGSVDLYDCTNLVKRACEIGMPFVAVTFNYRLGVLGFLHSRELVADAALQTDVPPRFRSTGNLGLVDAYYAFDWVKRNIATFGGDPEQITAIGESAGAGTINYLVLSPQLQIHVKRIILCSSTTSTIQLLRPDQAQASFESLCRNVGIDTGGTDAKAVSRLRGVGVEELVEKAQSISHAFRPAWDDITISADPREVVFKPELWNDSLTDVIIGVCQSESWMRQATQLNRKVNLHHYIEGRIPPNRPDLRERAYKLYSDESEFPWYKVPKGVLPEHRGPMAFEGQIRYYSPTNLFSESFIRKPCSEDQNGQAKDKTLYRYILSWTTDHFPASWPVTHTADILLTFLHDSLSATERKVALSFTDQLIAFTAGRKEQIRWKQYTAGEKLWNELQEDGKWRQQLEGTGEFDLDDEYSAFCKEAMRASLDYGRRSWKGMAR